MPSVLIKIIHMCLFVYTCMQARVPGTLVLQSIQSIIITFCSSIVICKKISSSIEVVDPTTAQGY